MNCHLIISILLIMEILYKGTAQTPYYSAPNNFYANQVQAMCGSGSNSYSLAAAFPISTAAHRMPFYAITAV